jgi:hypothetical protein
MLSALILTLLLGPFLSLLPKRLRDALPSTNKIFWRPATVLSGLLEFLFSFYALIYWYSYSITTWASHSLVATMDAHPEAEVPPIANGFAGMAIVFLHPFTWLLVWLLLESPVRALAAAFTVTIHGSSVLFLLDRLYLLVTRRQPKNESLAVQQRPLNSYLDAIHQKVVLASTPLVPDEILITTSGSDELLEIRSCRPKENWDPPRTIRYNETYYRLESAYTGSRPRPFHYHLRRLPAGVPSRHVLIYSPDPPPITLA